MQSDVIKLALERGILGQAQAEALRQLSDEIASTAASSRENFIALRDDEPTRLQDDEDLKFVGGFGDVFVSIGLALFLWAVIYFSSKLGGVSGATHIERFQVVSSASMTGAITWILAEYFTRKRRMALPSIILLLVFVACCLTFFGVLFVDQEDGRILKATAANIDNTGSDLTERWIIFGRIFAACAATSLLAVIYYWRFRVPVAVAGAVAVSGVIFLALIFTLSPEFTKEYARYIIFFYGLAVFALAMRFDMSDTSRRTRRTDIAFWLHLLAAPLIVHPLLNPIARGDTLTAEQAILIIAVFLLLGVIAVVIDRRALLVSSMTYAGVSLVVLVKKTGLDVGNAIPLTFFALGGFILLISIGWHPLRRLALSSLPAEITRRLYNPPSLEAMPS